MFWNNHIQNKSNILDIKYEDLVSEYTFHQKKIYKFLEVNSNYDEKRRSDFFSQTASTRQVKEGVHRRSIEKKDFLQHKSEFMDALLMQREYWGKKNILPIDNKFFGYSLY